MKSYVAPYYVVLFACLLIVVGDLRFLISPIGYWIAWGAVVAIGCFFTGCMHYRRINIELFIYLVGFFLVFVSFVLSGVVNDSNYTLYQGVKILCVAVMFVCIFMNAENFTARRMYVISAICIGAGLFFFLLSKYFLRDLYVVFGDGRQGSVFAYPGVLWKTSVFFVGFIIAGMMFGGENKLLSLLALVGALYLLIMDSSRTGFLMLAMVVFMYVILYSRISPKTIFFVLLVLSICGIGLFLLHISGGLILSQSNEPLVLNRLAAGDPTRAQMLVDGVLHAEQCIPLGCGFGTATTLVHGEPMVVHNAYLSALGDIGILGFTGMTILMFSPIVFFLKRFRGFRLSDDKSIMTIAYAVAAFGGAAGYAFLMMLHPFSTELSEWGIWIIMVSILSSLMRRMAECNSEEKVDI
ncbi:hypothetical protein GHO34_07785 [Pseudomonas sp. FSL R10-2245]|uniref:hypothetical protein n=1 Tax=Pseudomonas sp. FSL R10-2245 TaxID=2662200 RepID=UPI0012965DE1|nr:hypothetical protein [Pseudomonas sp. FSL R10-2245]MQU00188.1 hypothetical protein [Pseudomonas sp. FSL R10-2245]